MSCRCLSFEEFSVVRRNFDRSCIIDDQTMIGIYRSMYVSSDYFGGSHYHAGFADMLEAAEKVKLLQEAIDI